MIYLRRDGEGAPAVEGRRAADLAAEGGSVTVTATTPIALAEDGPFEPLASALTRSGAVRDAFATGIAIPSLRHHRRLCLALLVVVAAPIVMLIDLDRRVVMSPTGGSARLFADLLAIAWIVYELTRRSPRRPGIAAAALVMVALRWIALAAWMCGRGQSVVVLVAAAVPAAAAGVILARIPSAARVTLELAGKLGIGRSDLREVERVEEPPASLVAAAVACAAALPALLHLLRVAGAGLVVQSLVFVVFAAVAPAVARRTMGTPAGRAPPVPPPPARVLLGTAVGLALTVAIVTSGRLFFDTGTELARCFHRLDSEARLARATEAGELARAVAKLRGSVPLVLMASTVFPFAEERIYRGLLQDVLVRRYGSAYGVFAASFAFAIAHLGIYEVALYQSLLLGIGFGVAFAEGGLLAAFFVHATWNLLQLV